MTLLADLEAFVHDHRPHGGMTGDATQPAWNGYLLTVACACGVVFERWVTIGARRADIHVATSATGAFGALSAFFLGFLSLDVCYSPLLTPKGDRDSIRGLASGQTSSSRWGRVRAVFGLTIKVQDGRADRTKYWRRRKDPAMNRTALRRFLPTSAVAFVAILAPLIPGLTPLAGARITRIVIDSVQSPTFAGTSFGNTGQYEKIVGRAFGEVDPDHRLNGVITDIQLAPRNVRGNVEYQTSFFLFKPIDMSRGNGNIFYNVVNRGNKDGLTTFNRATTGGNNPGAAASDAGDGLLMRQGYPIVWSGWQPDVLPGNNRMTMTVPVATNPDGSPIIGKLRTEYVVTAPTSTQDLGDGIFTAGTHASYETVSVDNAGATLTRRVREADPREPISNADWKFADCSVTPFPGVPHTRKICLKGGFDTDHIYELIYTAKNPTVLGLGFAATRDLISFFRRATHDDFGTANPLAMPALEKKTERGIRHAIIMGSSQGGRYVRTLIHLGFNEDEDGRIVFEGAFAHKGPARIPLNIRFGAPGRGISQHDDHLFPASESPFTYSPIQDPIAERTDGILERCHHTSTCPKVVHIVSSLEYWLGRQSLDHTDALGRHDVGLPDSVRLYLMSSTQHSPAPVPAPGTLPSPGICRWPANPAPQAETLRAVWVALDQWVNQGVKPPPSQVPTLRHRTLVPPDPATFGFPNIPATNYVTATAPVNFNGLHNPLTLADYGPEFNAREESGNITNNPPLLVGGSDYAVHVPEVDADGNDVDGVRSTTIQVPIGTYTGWNRRAPGFSADELCSVTGLFIPFARTADQRFAAGDPRLSLEERYGTHEMYVKAVQVAADRLAAEGLLLPEDATRLVAEADASDVLK